MLGKLNEWHSINTRLIEREDMKIEENYIEKMCNEIARIVTEAIQNLSIEDVNMYQVGYIKAIEDAVECVIQMIAELDVGNCTKYGNKNAEQQSKSYNTLMKYEVAGSIDDLLDRLEQLKKQTKL